MQEHLVETRYARRNPERAGQERQGPHFGRFAADASDRLSAVQNDFPIVVADGAAELRKRRLVDGIAFFLGVHFRGRALVPIRLFPPLFENFVVSLDQRLSAEQVVNAREPRRQRQMMLGRMEITRKNDEDPASCLQDAVALSQRTAYVLHVLEDIVGQYG